MNGSNRHAAYRRRLQRRRRLRRVLLLLGILLLLLLAGFLILGTLSAEREEPPTSSDTEEGGERETPALPTSVNAHPLYFETSDATSLASRLQALRKQSAKDASVPLNRTDGSPLYSSTLINSLGVGSADYSVTVSRASSQAKTYGVRLCGVWHLTAFSEKDALLRSVRLSETASLLAEAMKNGVNDILLFAPDLRPESLEELLLLSENVHRLYEGSELGLCIPSSFLEAEHSDVLIDDLVGGFDFLAIDATAVGQNETAVAHIESVAANHLDHLLRYNMRLLLPYSADAAEQASIIGAAEQYSTKSWQILTPDP